MCPPPRPSRGHAAALACPRVAAPLLPPLLDPTPPPRTREPVLAPARNTPSTETVQYQRSVEDRGTPLTTTLCGRTYAGAVCRGRLAMCSGPMNGPRDWPSVYYCFTRNGME